jgi:hypothetical protein
MTVVSASHARHAQTARRANLPHPDGCCLVGQIRTMIRASRACKRGASRSSRTLGAGCDGRGVLSDEQHIADGEIVWSWRPKAGVTFCEMTQGNGDNKVWSPGRSRISRKTIAQGRPVVPARTCGSAACFFSARGPWVRRAPGLPCALFFERGWNGTKTRTHRAARTYCDVALNWHALRMRSMPFHCLCASEEDQLRARQDQHTDARAARSCQHRTSPQWLNDQATLAVGATLDPLCGHFRSILGPRSVKRRVLSPGNEGGAPDHASSAMRYPVENKRPPSCQPRAGLARLGRSALPPRRRRSCCAG